MVHSGDTRTTLRSWLTAAIPAFLITIGMPFAIIQLPSLSTLLLTLGGLFFSLIYFFYKLFRSSANKRKHGYILTLFAALAFITAVGMEYRLVQEKVLFGYKAVNDDLNPSLVNGDHYFGDKLLYKNTALKKGDIYVIRNRKGKVFAARLLYLPGDKIALNGMFHTLKKDEYGLYSGHKNTPAVVVGKEGILAKAVVIYWSFDPHTNSPVWGRSGELVR